MTPKTPETNIPELNFDQVDLDKVRKQGTEHLAAGVGIGLASIGAAVLIGASCPLCVVAAPALVGSGIWKRRKAKKLAERAAETGDQVSEGADGSLAAPCD